MKTFVAILVIAFGLSVQAAPDLPHYFPKLHGTVKASLFDSGAFDFVGGKILGCTKTEADIAVAWVCDLQGATATVTSSQGQATTGTFDRVRVLSRLNQEYGWFTEYRFESLTYQPLTLFLTSFDVTPDDVSGSVGLTEYGVYGGIRATTVR